MSSSLLDLYSVKDNIIHGECIKSEYGIKEEWWSRYRAQQERRLALAIGAVPEKEPVPVPDVPRMALGKSAAAHANNFLENTAVVRLLYAVLR